MREFAAVEHGFQDRGGFLWQAAEPDLLFVPEQDTCAQLVGLHPPFHDDDLIWQVLRKKCVNSVGASLLRLPRAVEIVAARQVALGKARSARGATSLVSPITKSFPRCGRIFADKKTTIDNYLKEAAEAGVAVQ
jgi:hypothetical protein